MVTTEYMVKLGVSEEEAEIYFHLIELGRATVGQISARTSMSRAKIYTVLDKLQQKRWASLVQDSPKTFLPEDPALVISHFKNEVIQIADNLIQELKPKYERMAKPVELQTLNGIEVYRKVFDFLESCKEDVFATSFFVHPELMEDYIKAIDLAISRGVSFKIILPSDLVSSLGSNIDEYNVRLSATLGAGMIIVDGTHLLFASSPRNDNELHKDIVGIWTQNPDIIDFSVMMFNRMYEEAEDVKIPR